MRELARSHAGKYRKLKEAQNKANRALQAFAEVVLPAFGARKP
jgi:hypothetical protein